MARRKNVKRIDPRYFLHETVNRDINTGEALEEERQAPVTHWIAGPGGLVDQHGDVFVKHGTPFAATRKPGQPGMMVIGVNHGTGTERWFSERPVPYEDVQKHSSNSNYNPPRPGPEHRPRSGWNETVNRNDDGSALEESGAEINAAFGGPINLRLPQTLIDRVKELMALPPGHPHSITPETGPTIVVQINNALQKADEAERAELHALKKELIDSGAVKQSRGQEDREAHRHRRAVNMGAPLEEGEGDLDPESLINKTKEILDSGAELSLDQIHNLRKPINRLQRRLYDAGKRAESSKQYQQTAALLRALDKAQKASEPVKIWTGDGDGDPYAADHEERGQRAKANWDREMHQRGGFKR